MSFHSFARSIVLSLSSAIPSFTAFLMKFLRFFLSLLDLNKSSSLDLTKIFFIPIVTFATLFLKITKANINNIRIDANTIMNIQGTFLAQS